MKELKTKIIVAAMIIAIVLIVIFAIINYKITDRVGPVIVVGYNSNYDEEKGDSSLLEGVNAYDSKDGDVSSSLIVESVVRLDGNKVKVTYVAVDSSNNVSKAKKILNIVTKERE